MPVYSGIWVARRIAQLVSTTLTPTLTLTISLPFLTSPSPFHCSSFTSPLLISGPPEPFTLPPSSHPSTPLHPHHPPCPGGIRGVLGLHETVCTGAADGYARMCVNLKPTSTSPSLPSSSELNASSSNLLSHSYTSSPLKPGSTPAMVILHLGPGLANGIANLHNARRARSPVLCLVGQMASWHIDADPLLNMPIAPLALTVSHAVLSAKLLSMTGPPPAEQPLLKVQSSTEHHPDGVHSSEILVERASQEKKGEGIKVQDLSVACSFWEDAVATGGRYMVGEVAVQAGGGGSTVGTGERKQYKLPVGGEPWVWECEEGLRDSRVVTLIVPHDLTWEAHGSSTAAAFGSEAAKGGRVAAEAPAGPIQSGPGIGEGGGGGTRVTATEGGGNGVNGFLSQGMTGGGSVGREGNGEVLENGFGATGEGGEIDGMEGVQCPEAVARFMRECAAEMKKVERGKAALFLGGEGLLGDEAGGGLHWAGLIAAATGSPLFCESFFSRADRGAGRPALKRLPYFPTEAEKALSTFELVVVVDTRIPVAMFGYKDGPSQLFPAALLAEDRVWEIDTNGVPGTAVAALKLLAEELEADKIVVPGKNCGGLFHPPSRPKLPNLSSPLNPVFLCTTLAACQPADCILVDESLTSGSAYWDLAKGCPPFTHLTLTGGAIGSGPPMALGAAIACPNRRVINFQADGSCMYSLQAFWSQAREMCDITTIICSNSSYNILKVECSRQRLPAPGKATRSLTDLSSPSIDWVALAQGLGVPGVRVTKVGELLEALKHSFATPGPMLIMALL